jgi:hypothetical protein
MPYCSCMLRLRHVFSFPHICKKLRERTSISDQIRTRSSREIGIQTVTRHLNSVTSAAIADSGAWPRQPKYSHAGGWPIPPSVGGVGVFVCAPTNVHEQKPHPGKTSPSAASPSHELADSHGYFSFPAPPIFLALPPATAIHIEQGTGSVSLPAPSVRQSLLFDNSRNEKGSLRRRFSRSTMISLSQYDLYGLYDRTEY